MRQKCYGPRAHRLVLNDSLFKPFRTEQAQQFWPVCWKHMSSEACSLQVGHPLSEQTNQSEKSKDKPNFVQNKTVEIEMWKILRFNANFDLGVFFAWPTCVPIVLKNVRFYFVRVDRKLGEVTWLGVLSCFELNGWLKHINPISGDPSAWDSCSGLGQEPEARMLGSIVSRLASPTAQRKIWGEEKFGMTTRHRRHRSATCKVTPYELLARRD